MAKGVGSNKKNIFFNEEAAKLSASENILLDTQEKIEAYYSEILGKLSWNTQKKQEPWSKLFADNYNPGGVLTQENLLEAYNKLMGIIGEEKKTVAKVSDETQTRQVLDMLSDMLDRWIENPRCVRSFEINMSNDMAIMNSSIGMPPEEHIISTEYVIRISVVEPLKEKE